MPPAAEEKEKSETPAPAEVVEMKKQPPRRNAPPTPPTQAVDEYPSEAPASRKKGERQDFFEYLQTITPEEWATSKTGGIYIYRESPKGNVRVNDEPLHRAITLQELREEYASKYGPGTYRLQFNTTLKHLSSCGERVTIDPQGGVLAAPYTQTLYGAPVPQDFAGMGQAFQTVADISKNAATAAVEVVKSAQIEQNKPIDLAAIITAIATLTPKKDDSFLINLLENQRKDAESRAARDLQAAQERASRDQQFFQLLQSEQEKRANERAELMRGQVEMQQKFFEAMMQKEKERADSLGQFTGLIKGFLDVREKIEESFSGGNRPQGWEGIIGTAIDKAGEILPAIMQARAGGVSATIHPSLVASSSQPPSPPTREMEFLEMISRIGKYLQRDVNLWDGIYIVRLIETEYGGIHADLFINQPKEVILETLKAASPIGKAIMEHETAAQLISNVIDVIKDPELTDQIFPEEEGQEEVAFYKREPASAPAPPPAPRRRGRPPKLREDSFPPQYPPAKEEGE